MVVVSKAVTANSPLNSVIDINEYLTNNGGCFHNCTNTDGSYRCECPTGHVLQPDKLTCLKSELLII